MSSIECALVGACIERAVSAWSLNSRIRLMVTLYSVSFPNFHHDSKYRLESFAQVKKSPDPLYWLSRGNFPGHRVFCTGILHNILAHPEKGSSLCLHVHPFNARYHCYPQLGPPSGETKPRHVCMYVCLYIIIWLIFAPLPAILSDCPWKGPWFHSQLSIQIFGIGSDNGQAVCGSVGKN